MGVGMVHGDGCCLQGSCQIITRIFTGRLIACPTASPLMCRETCLSPSACIDVLQHCKRMQQH